MILLRNILLASVFCTLIILPSSAFACKCDPAGSLQDSYEAASAVFVGRAIDVGINPLKPNELKVQFSPAREYKGSFKELSLKYATIYTAFSGQGSCGIPFQAGQDYLVFANGNPAYYHTSVCTPTSQLDALDKKVLGELDKLRIAAEEKAKKEALEQ